MCTKNYYFVDHFHMYSLILLIAPKYFFDEKIISTFILRYATNLPDTINQFFPKSDMINLNQNVDDSLNADQQRQIWER